MRVGVNAFFLQQHTTGSGQYTAQLLRALRRINSNLQTILYSTGQSDAGQDNDWMVQQTPAPFPRLGPNWQKLWFEQVAFPRACRSAGVDIAHVPYFASPIASSIPVVVTVHDLIPVLLPAYRGSLPVRLYTRLVSAAARRASWIITDSHCSKQDIVQHLRVAPERVQVIYLAADELCRPVRDPDALAAIRHRYGLPQQYILYLGGFDQRKNLRGLLLAFDRAQGLLGADCPKLVIAGSLPDEDSALFPDPRRIAGELGLQGKVVFAGWVSEADKPALYSGALFFAFLSLYEGFGLMALEAMSCGVPVLASSTSSLPEIVGTGGLLVRPDDPDQVAQSMAELLRRPGLREQLAEKALLRAGDFSWQRTAEQTMEVYHRTALR